MLYGHGDDTHIVKGQLQANFSSNVLPERMDKGLSDCLKNSIHLLENYPEPLAESLAQAISNKENISSENILITHGATEAFYLVAELYKKAKTTILVPSFAEYEDACRKYKHSIAFADNSRPLEELLANQQTIWLCNPNNPDGKIYDTGEIAILVKKYPKVTFIVDEAYIDFSPKAVSLINEVENRENLVIIRSLTKKYVIPGLRLGYLVGHTTMIARLKELLMPWRIGSLVVEGGLFIVNKMRISTGVITDLLEESQQLQKTIDLLPDFSVKFSDTHYFLVECPCTAKEMKQYLLEQHKILIRDASNFRGLSQNDIRISTQNSSANKKLLTALEEWKPTYIS